MGKACQSGRAHLGRWPRAIQPRHAAMPRAGQRGRSLSGRSRWEFGSARVEDAGRQQQYPSFLHQASRNSSTRRRQITDAIDAAALGPAPLEQIGELAEEMSRRRVAVDDARLRASIGSRALSAISASDSTVQHCRSTDSACSAHNGPGTTGPGRPASRSAIPADLCLGHDVERDATLVNVDRLRQAEGGSRSSSR